MAQIMDANLHIRFFAQPVPLHRDGDKRLAAYGCHLDLLLCRGGATLNQPTQAPPICLCWLLQSNGELPPVTAQYSTDEIHIAQGFASGFIVVSAEEKRQSLKYQKEAQRIRQ
jgi:hypothetical protein